VLVACRLTQTIARMNQIDLYTTFRALGCEILVFEDHPQFFGNWRAHFKFKRERYEIVSDNREGWLTLWRYDAENKGERVFEVISSQLNEKSELALLKQWLTELGGK
jgi:hypothetical protein